MKFSLPQTNRAPLAQLVEQANIELVSTGKLSTARLTSILDACFTSGFTLSEVELALDCEVDNLSEATSVGAHQLLALISRKTS